MSNLVLEFHGFKFKPHVEIDGKKIRIKNSKQCQLQLGYGKHEIFICERRSVFHWYWWWPIFNLYYMLLLLKQYVGHSLGFDGECVFALFQITCFEEAQTIIRLQRKELSWDKTEKNADYNMLYIQSNEKIVLKQCSLNKNIRFRLKFNAISPLMLLILIFTLCIIIFRIKRILLLWELILSCAIDCCMIGFLIYKIYKTVKQDSFDQTCNISRIIIKNQNIVYHNKNK